MEGRLMSIDAIKTLAGAHRVSGAGWGGWQGMGCEGQKRRAEGVCSGKTGTHERKVPWEVRTGSSMGWPVSLSTTVERAMLGRARLMMCSASSAVRKLWYSHARGLHDKCSTLRRLQPEGSLGVRLVQLLGSSVTDGCWAAPHSPLQPSAGRAPVTSAASRIGAPEQSTGAWLIEAHWSFDICSGCAQALNLQECCL